MGDPKQNPARRKSGGVWLGIVQDDPQCLQPKEEGLLLGLRTSSLHSSRGGSRHTRFGEFSRLLGSLVQVVECRVGSVHSLLHSSQSHIRTKRRGLGSLLGQLLSSLVQFGKLRLNQLGHFLGGTGRDFVHSARVSNRLLGSRLTQRSIQRSCFLRGLQAHHGLGILGAILDRVTGSTQVQGSQALSRSQGGVGNRQQRIDGSFVRRQNLFVIQCRHGQLLKKDHQRFNIKGNTKGTSQILL